ncbi:MAG: 23S rRNA (pseudouridine(1915)-N(3))-methyltransferase RlmH [Acidobacteriota bacterium]|nr:23S rRNA (pseudouridine(1915)-N(3))-methyltransferase RlmH [Acidobacteriota bacterium]
MQIRIISEGKTKDERLRALQADYAARIRHFTRLEVEEVPPSRRTGKKPPLTSSERRLLEKTRQSLKVALDERGKEMTSPALAEWMSKAAARGGVREIAFLVGGPDGFTESFRSQADFVLALSRMTLTRDWSMTLLLEQIYRGFTIERGYPYPR